MTGDPAQLGPVEIELRVTVRVEAKPNPDYFTGWNGRTDEDLAVAALEAATLGDPELMDGWADLTGSVRIVSVEP